MSKEFDEFMDGVKNNYSSVEKLIDKDIFDQAKQMHKEEIVKAHKNKTIRTIKQGIDVYETISGEQYYNETYGGQDERNN